METEKILLAQRTFFHCWKLAGPVKTRELAVTLSAYACAGVYPSDDAMVPEIKGEELKEKRRQYKREGLEGGGGGVS